MGCYIHWEQGPILLQPPADLAHLTSYWEYTASIARWDRRAGLKYDAWVIRAKLGEVLDVLGLGILAECLC